MIYTCAYYRKESDDLATAQNQQARSYCRKLRLQPANVCSISVAAGRFGDARAENYGVQATGITLSAAQAKFALERIAERGLSDRCTIRDGFPGSSN